MLTGDESWGKPSPPPPPPQPAQPPSPPLPFSRQQVEEILQTQDLETVSTRDVRQQLEAKLGLERKALKPYVGQIDKICFELMESIEAADDQQAGHAKRHKS